MKVNFISEQYFKENTPVSANFEVTTPLLPVIHEAQFKYIRPILCEELYSEISSQIKNDNLTVENEFLLKTYIQPAVSYYTYYLVLPFAWAKLRDAGLVIQSGDNYSAVTRNDVEYMRNTVLESANTYAIILEKYLNENRSIYPLYDACKCRKESKVFDRWFKVI
jgi:hypothetical protein